MTNSIETLTAIVDELVAKNEIQELYQRYARAVDRLDRGELERIYHPDAIEEHGIYDGPIGGFIDLCFEKATVYKAMHHMIAPALIEVDGDQATAEAYYFMYQRNQSDGIDNDEFFGGRYVDRFEKRHGEWRIAHRRMVLDYGRAEPANPWLTDEIRSHLTLIEGRRDLDDAVFARQAVSA